MKKGMAGLMFCALFLLSACGELLGGPSISAMSKLPSSASAAEAGVFYTVERAVEEETATAEDGTEVAHCRYELPVLRAYREDGTEITEAQTDAEARAVETVRIFDAKFDSWAKDANFSEIADWARDGYALSGEQGSTALWLEGVIYESELTCSVWQTKHMVSIFGEYYSYTGGAHPNTVRLAWNFDLEGGAFVEATALALDEREFQDAVTAEILRQAELPQEDGTIPSQGYWENYREIAAQWPSYAVYFDDAGMHVDFSAYEMASYAAGPQCFIISPETLEPYLSAYGRAMLSLPEA